MRTSKWAVLMLLLLFVSCKNKQKEIIAFNDAIIKEQEAIINSETKLIKSTNDRLLTQIDSNYTQFLDQITHSDSAIKALTDPDPEIGFKQAALHLFSVYKAQTQQGYKTLVELAKIPDSLFTERQAKQFEELSTSVFNTLNTEIHAFTNVQNQLATKYKFTFNK